MVGLKESRANSNSSSEVSWEFSLSWEMMTLLAQIALAAPHSSFLLYSIIIWTSSLMDSGPTVLMFGLFKNFLSLGPIGPARSIYKKITKIKVEHDLK